MSTGSHLTRPAADSFTRETASPDQLLVEVTADVGRGGAALVRPNEHVVEVEAQQIAVRNDGDSPPGEPSANSVLSTGDGDDALLGNDAGDAEGIVSASIRWRRCGFDSLAELDTRRNLGRRQGPRRLVVLEALRRRSMPSAWCGRSVL